MGVFAVASASDVTLHEFSLGWSLWLVVGGASASTLGGFIVAITRCPSHPVPKPSTRTIGPSRNPAEGATSPHSGQHEAPGTGEDPRRVADVTDIFNVVSFSSGSSEEAGSYSAGRNSPYCWTEMDHPPPPYSLVRLGPTEGGGQAGTEDNPSTQVRELSLSPPPPYESVYNEPPPPYRHTPPPRVRSSPENGDWHV